VAMPTDLVQRTLDLLILRTLALQPMDGWGIAQRIRQVSKEVSQVKQEALYPALHPSSNKAGFRPNWENRKTMPEQILCVDSGRREIPAPRASALEAALPLAIDLVLETP
jgi:PadR family transcriptional regulator, regulatory protein PadR